MTASDLAAVILAIGFLAFLLGYGALFRRRL